MVMARASGHHINKSNCVRTEPGCSYSSTCKLCACQKECLRWESPILNCLVCPQKALRSFTGLANNLQNDCAAASAAQWECSSPSEYTAGILYVDSKPFTAYLKYWFLCSLYHFKHKGEHNLHDQTVFSTSFWSSGLTETLNPGYLVCDFLIQSRTTDSAGPICFHILTKLWSSTVALRKIMEKCVLKAIKDMFKYPVKISCLNKTFRYNVICLFFESKW